MKKVFIIHFQPLELFPPVMNMIDFVGKEKDLQVIVSTNTKSSKNSLHTYHNAAVKIYRPASLSHSGIGQYVQYVAYYLSTFLYLLWHRPETVLYIETLSSWPAILYKKIRGGRVRLMVHYHEYTEPRLYKDGMVLSRWMHKAERKMYPKYSWISHTNPVRMKMFVVDCQLEKMDSSIFHILPNYPPQKWSQERITDYTQNKITKLVFVGSLGYQNMYLQEVIDWLCQHQEEFTLDIYSYNIDAKAKGVLENCHLSNINYFGGCDYLALPQILKNYDIGLDIYKPFALNHVHGVSNKVFEYFACGLDVWFTIDKPQTLRYLKDESYPKVLPVNFQKLKSFDYQSAISRKGLDYLPSNYFYENIYPELMRHIKNDEKT